MSLARSCLVRLRLAVALVVIAIVAPASDTVAAQSGPRPAVLDTVRPAGWVTDLAGVLTVTERQQLDDLLERFHRRTQAEVAVVTVSSLGGRRALDVATMLGRRWRVGPLRAPDDPLHDSGVLLLLAPVDRAVAIAVAEGANRRFFPNRLADSISVLMTEEFRVGRWAPGLQRGLTEIMRVHDQALTKR